MGRCVIISSTSVGLEDTGQQGTVSSHDAFSGNENTVSKRLHCGGDLVIPCKCHYGLGWAAECVLYVG